MQEREVVDGSEFDIDEDVNGADGRGERRDAKAAYTQQHKCDLVGEGSKIHDDEGVDREGIDDQHNSLWLLPCEDAPLK